MAEQILEKQYLIVGWTKLNMISLSICLYNCHNRDEQMRAKTKCIRNMMSHVIISCQDL